MVNAQKFDRRTCHLFKCGILLYFLPFQQQSIFAVAKSDLHSFHLVVALHTIDRLKCLKQNKSLQVMVSMTLFKVQMEHNFQEKIAFSHFRKNESCEFEGLKVSLEQICTPF